MPTTSYMGGTVRRREDPRLITGSATYVDDIELPGMLHLAVLRSPFAHARILSIDSSAAEELPGVVAVVRGEEVQDLIPPAGSEAKGEGESGPPPRIPLAVQVTNYVGDPVVGVVATEAAIAEDALELIAVDYEEMKAVVDAEEAMSDGMPQIHPYADHNIDNVRDFSAGDVDAAFTSADVTISARLVEQRLSPNPMETRGVVASYEPGSGQLTVWISTQAAHLARDVLCEALKLPQTKVRAIAPEVGGGFGCKIGAYPEDVLAAYLARKLRRPVKWIESRSEHMQATTHGRSQLAYLDLAATADGRVTGLKLKLIVDSGAYGAAWAGEISAAMVTGCYPIQNVRTQVLTVLTNKTPLGAYRGAGRPEAAYYIERGMDMLARELGIDPAEIRRRNFIRPEAFPYRLADTWQFDSGEYQKALDAALDRADYRHMREEQTRLRSEGRIIGIGLASYVEVAGFGWETSTVRMEADGTVTIYTGISPHGQGQETTFAQITADVLGVPPENVNVRYGDTSMGSGFGTMGSRGTAVGGPAVHGASTAIRDKMRAIAAHMIEAAPEDMDLSDDGWAVKGVPSSVVSIEEIARKAYGGGGLPEDMEPGLSATSNFSAEDVTAPFGTHVAQVEIDRDTGKVTILKILTVDDCGTVISPQLVQGQVHGGLAQGISQALYEEVEYSPEGQLLTGTLANYAVPTIGDLPMYETSHTHTPTFRNPLGIKGVGEAATIGSTPALVNAVIDALSPFGVKNLDMPLSPEKVWTAIGSAQPAASGAS
jgi:aerobic carbon-monoxide dehydrogenase large subunit